MKQLFTILTLVFFSSLCMADDAISVTLDNATYGFGDFGSLTISGTSSEGHAVALELAEWKSTGAGTYENGSMWGSINEKPVANLNATAVVSQEGTTWIITTTLVDADNTSYAFSSTGAEPQEEEIVYEPVDIVAYNMEVIVEKYGGISLKAYDDEKNLIWIKLDASSAEAYGEYGYTNGSDESKVLFAKYKDIFLAVNAETNEATYYLKDGAKCFEGVFSLTDGEQIYNNRIYNISITTAPKTTTALDHIPTNQNTTKVIKNNQIYILKNDVLYNILGNTIY